MKKSPDVLYTKRKMQKASKDEFENQLRNMALRNDEIDFLMDIQAGLTTCELCSKYNLSESGKSKKFRRLSAFVHQFDSAHLK